MNATLPYDHDEEKQLEPWINYVLFFQITFIFPYTFNTVNPNLRFTHPDQYCQTLSNALFLSRFHELLLNSSIVAWLAKSGLRYRSLQRFEIVMKYSFPVQHKVKLISIQVYFVLCIMSNLFRCPNKGTWISKSLVRRPIIDSQELLLIRQHLMDSPKEVRLESLPFISQLYSLFHRNLSFTLIYHLNILLCLMPDT